MRSTAPSAASACSATDAGLPRPAAGVIRSRFLFAVACAAFTLALAGCGTLPRNAVPTELVGEALNGKDVGGRALTVSEARPREPRSGGDRRGGFGGGGRRW